MRSLEEIFGTTHVPSPHLVTREIVFELGKWCIYRRVSIRGDESMVFIMIHRCERANARTAIEAGYLDPGKCRGCGTKTPDDMQTIYALSAWRQYAL